jgi:hypothetical protein
VRFFAQGQPVSSDPLAFGSIFGGQRRFLFDAMHHRLVHAARNVIKCSTVNPSMNSMHDHLWTLCRKLPTDFAPWGERDRDTAEPWQDCSCGCRHFVKLAGELGNDWDRWFAFRDNAHEQYLRDWLEAEILRRRH